MIRDDQIPELRYYRRSERQLQIDSNASYEPLVVFGSNQNAAIHNWFRFKEGFSSDLLPTFLQEFGELLPRRNLTLLDPFCGSGTSLISAQFATDKQIRAIGIERNPFIHFVAQTKAAWRNMNSRLLVADGMRAFNAATEIEADLPDLSGIQTGRCISQHIARRLIAIGEAARQGGRNSDFIRLGIASAIEPLSRVRKDGRALRIVKKPRRMIRPVLEGKWQRMASDVEHLSTTICNDIPDAAIHLGDGRNPTANGVEAESVDLIFTSPPYPNNIDYSEVYKLELWMLGFVESSSQFLNLRYSTVRSHPTFDRQSTLNSDFMDEVQHGRLCALLGATTNRLQEAGEQWRAKMLLAYFSDLWDALRNYRQVLRENGIAVFVIGNSLHGNENPALIASDIILAEMAESLGFHSQISIARGLKRRLVGNHFLRESLVLLKR